ncbi:MAG: hydantoinase B/oxoprolinase family protein [Solirubrobacterales bacterium]
MEPNQFFMTAEDVQADYGVDLITAETLRNGFIEATRHMHGTLLRSSFSNIIRDGMDFGVCVHLVNDDGTTDMVAITEGCTQFAFTHQHMTNMVLDEYGIENLGPGDTVICNDEWRGGIHFGDLNLFRVVHDEDGSPAFVVSDAAHVFDIGGPVPGGFNTAATTMYEEGLRISPTLITAADKPVRSMFNLLLENTRSPMHMLGDVRALLGTLRAGEERVRQLMERYGTASVKGSARYALGLSERRMRQALLSAPDGDYEDEIHLDDDGISTEPLKVRVQVRIRGSEAEIDFSGTDPQSLGSVKTGWQEAARAVVGPKVVLDPRHPMNAGAMRPFQVLLPPGSMVLSLPPASQSNHVELGAKIARLMTRVMSKAVPERAVADDSGTSGCVIMGGVDSRPGLEGQPYGGVLLMGGAWGATEASDGISFCQSSLFNCRSMIIEYSEKAMPVVIWEHGVLIDAAGSGKYRGGFAASYTFEALADAFITPIMDSSKFPAGGLSGGGEASMSFAAMVEKDERGQVHSFNGLLPLERMTPLFGYFASDGVPDPVDGEWGEGTLLQTSKPTAYEMKSGELMRVFTACGGGYGDPLERDVEAVLADVRGDLISLGQAAQVYGVEIDPASLVVDAAATAATRKKLAAERASGPPIAHPREWPRTQAEFEAMRKRALAAPAEVEV